MKINVTHVLKNFDGKPMKENRETEEKDDEGNPIFEMQDLTLRSVLCTALIFTTKEETRSTPDADLRIRRFLLAQDIYKNDVVELKSEDVTDLKNRVNQRFQTQVVAAVLMRIDPATKPKKAESAIGV